jgi:hypothetical protein
VQPGTIPVQALGCCKVPNLALGEFVPAVAPPWYDHLGLVLVLGIQFRNGAPSASTESPFQHGAKTGMNLPSASTGSKNSRSAGTGMVLNWWLTYIIYKLFSNLAPSQFWQWDVAKSQCQHWVNSSLFWHHCLGLDFVLGCQH